VVRWREIYVFFENDLFDPEIGYYTPKISLEKCFSRLSSTQCSGPLGGNSYYSVEFFFVSAQNRDCFSAIMHDPNIYQSINESLVNQLVLILLKSAFF
jgi:hypothetical protein